MSAGEITVIVVSPGGDEAATLMAELDRDLLERYPRTR
jgi:hypothetical protein